MITEEIRKEIDSYFALKSSKGAFPISALKDTSPAWAINTDKEYGVYVEYLGDEVNEKFSKVSLKSESLVLNGKAVRKVLLLTCSEPKYRREFSYLCEEFVNPGDNGKDREKLITNPLEWWLRWTELLGDTHSDKLVYDIIGELMSLIKLLESGEEPFWSATEHNTHDIETKDASFEIKSSILKDRAQIHVSSQFQLQAQRPLYLIFTRLEKSLAGGSIDDLVSKIKDLDPNNYSSYENYLSSKGLVKGNHYRKIKYALLERRKILVDEHFPKITQELFADGKYPDNISHIEYDVNIDGIEYENWK